MEDKRPGLIKRTFRFFWRLLNGFRRLVFNLIFLAFVIFIVAGLFHKEGAAVPAGSALVLNPSGALVDQMSYSDPFSGLLSGNDAPAETLLSDMIKAIDVAATDDRIKLIVLQTDALQHSGISKTEELSTALQRFREHKKNVIAVGDSFSQDQYLLAAQADQIYMNPMGQVLLQGFGVYSNYFKSALDKLLVSVHVFRVGAFKSAVEPFLRDDMSDEVKENHLVWLNTLWNQYKGNVATRRQIAPEKLDEYINKIDEVFAASQGDTGKAAVSWHLVDALKTRDEINELLVKQVGADENGDFRGIDFRDYLTANNHLNVGTHGDHVGVIVASGVILDGEQRAGQVGGDTLAGLIRQARDDEQVKAVVLRIDSEGGSAFASEIIRQELLSLQKAGKPVVVSMGSIAASGGYWIAASADEVWATPGTITGSIGIFGAFPTIEKSLDKLGIHTDGVGTTTMAGAMRIDRPLDPITARAIQSNIDSGYQHFLAVVAAGRELDVAAVDKIAQGRVWSGSDAVTVGLVDKLGGLEEAVASAAARAQLKTYDTEWIEQPLSMPEIFIQKLSGTLSYFKPAVSARWYGAAAILSPLRPLIAEAQRFAQLNDPKSMYVYCVACARL
ncbi:MAG: signal peptide peptidase SppA [Verrucomicrobiaceae bacterium]|nr:signal peptide peptidase SppA [Verrucomicrobiaceae bacterium]